MSQPRDAPPTSAEAAQNWPAPGSSAKKRRVIETRGAYQRKRAATACELCRLRKSKCDNRRPQCGRCVASGAACVFRDRDRDADHSAFDPASLAILDRLNHAIGLLEAQQPYQEAPVALPRQSAFPLHSPEGGFELSPGLQGGAQEISTRADAPSGDGNSLGHVGMNVGASTTEAFSVNARCSCNCVLEWPIFDGQISSESVTPSLNDATGHLRQDSAPSGTPAGTGNTVVDPKRQRPVPPAKSTTTMLNGDMMMPVENFLRNVHTKNPIFDPAELLDLARAVAEDGFQWDSASCLVLIVCALGILSTPWTVAIPQDPETSLDDSESYSWAEAYYNAARKRLGLLYTSVQAVQCWFLTGVYEMYSMRPMSAWLSFNRACTMFQLHLHAQKGFGQHTLGRSEQRLYWSCVKSECEMREEFDLPPPGLTQIKDLDVFPSPPDSTSDPTGHSTASQGLWQYVDENSWYYYLSDLAYRRIVNRTITTLYGCSKEEWLSARVRQLARIPEELDNQIVQWWEHIPGSPAPAFQPDTDELTYMLWLNYVDLRERIWRPFLFIAVHRPLSEAEWPVVMAGARRCLDLCFEMLQGARLAHRHHGLWLTVRCMFTKALLVIAAAKSKRIEIRDGWKSYIHSFREYLNYWEAEAHDLSSMRSALFDLLEGSTE